MTPKQLRRVIVERAIQKFQTRWLQEVTNGKRDEDIRVCISSIDNYELILDEFNKDEYAVYEEDGDTFVKMRVFTNEEMEERSEQMSRNMMST
jgi:hypothetical protein